MIIIVVVIVTLVNSVVLINAKIPSESMEKTIMTGDRIFGFRLAYGLNLDFFGHEISKKIKDPERFDIVIFKYPDDESKLFTRSIIYNNLYPSHSSSLIHYIYFLPFLLSHYKCQYLYYTIFTHHIQDFETAKSLLFIRYCSLRSQ